MFFGFSCFGGLEGFFPDDGREDGSKRKKEALDGSSVEGDQKHE